jgi:formylglycine-generating enzyme required for sulfatase activity
MLRNRSLGVVLLLFISLALLQSVSVAGGEEQAAVQTRKVGATSTNPTDGAAMVWVPGGTFTMGSIDKVGRDNEHPAHKVTLSGYWIYRDDVTVSQYRAFCTATRHAMPLWPDQRYSWKGKSGWDDAALQQHPIVDVSWNDAQAYADWAKVVLPSEAQWEYASRGPQGNNYPWGGTATTADPFNGWDQTKCANFYNSREKNISTWPVGSFATDTSWCGAWDMAGNVYNWCADWYEAYSSSPVTNPTGPATGSVRVLRGGSWNDGDYYSVYGARGANRDYNGPDNWNYYFGFRCVSLSPGR